MLLDSDTAVAAEGVMGFGVPNDGDVEELALLMKALSSYFGSGGLACLYYGHDILSV